jgi:hypothetical protein
MVITAAPRGDEAERAHADRLVAKIAIEADEHAGADRRAEPQRNVLERNVHGRPIRPRPL